MDENKNSKSRFMHLITSDRWKTIQFMCKIRQPNLMMKNVICLAIIQIPRTFEAWDAQSL